MKKFLVILVVLAITSFSVMAFAAEVTVGGSLEVRSRDFSNLEALPSDVNLNSLVGASNAPGLTNAQTLDAFNKANDQRDTQNRIRIDVNAKTDNVKAKLELEQDFSNWGNFVEKYSNGSAVGLSTGLGFREAWVNFNLPGVPVNVNVGHQLLQLGMGTFFRSQHYGSDAWVLANVTGPNTVAFVDVKALENNTYSADDMDAYVLLDVFKINDKMNVGIDLTSVNDRRASLTNPGTTLATSTGTALSRAGGLVGGNANPFKDITLNNIGVNFTAALGALNLKAQIDMQSGKAAGQVNASNPTGADKKFKGNELVLKGDMTAGAATLNFTAARGSGSKSTDTDIKQFITILDIDPHYTFLYEYKVPTAALNAVSQTVTDDQLHTGFANTTALNIGAGMDVTKSLNIAAQLWYLKATQKVAINGATFAGLPSESTELGNEIDVKATWKLYDNLTWTWDLGYLMPGKAYDVNDPVTGQIKSADNVTGIQGILAFKF